MKIGIMGYGNLGRGVECAIKQNPDMELAAVFTRRAPETVIDPDRGRKGLLMWMKQSSGKMRSM